MGSWRTLSKLHLLALTSHVGTERVGLGDIHGRAVTEEAYQEVEVVPTRTTLPVSTTWAQVRDVVTEEAEGQGGRETRKCWSKPILHPTPPTWTASPRLPCPLTTMWSPREAPATHQRGISLSVPALCQHRGSAATVPSATPMPLRYVPGLSLVSRNTTMSFPHPGRPKHGHSFLLPSSPLLICSILPTPLHRAPSLDSLRNPSALFPDGPWLLGATKRDQMVPYEALAVQGRREARRSLAEHRGAQGGGALSELRLQV